MIELENWKKNKRFIEKKKTWDNHASQLGGSSVEKLKMENITKVKLCATGFEEVKNFPTDSPCCSRIGIRTTFSLITSNQIEIKSINIKTLNIRKLQKCVYSLADASRYWYLHAKWELVRLVAKVSSIDPGIFYWQNNSGLISTIACYMDMILGGTEYFKTNGIHNLKSTFKFGSEETETFVFITIELTQNSAYSICTEQNNYIASISEISQLKQRMSHVNSPLTNAERTQYRSALGQLLWVPNISRQDISFHVCEASTKLKNATVADIYYVNKIIRNVKSTKNCIKFPHLDLKTLQLKLFTDPNSISFQMEVVRVDKSSS